jgi:alginate O-acetyltransferase complex protein AlgI
MTIASFQFLAFSALVVLLFNVWSAVSWRQAVLLIANIYFLSTFSTDPRTYLPLAGFLVFGYASVSLLQSGRIKSAFLPILAIGICGFFWLKKYSFFPFFGYLQFPYVTLGLSYIFFRTLHLIIDARDGVLPHRVGPVGYLNYMLNFTTLVSGPIQLYPDFAASQLGPRPPLTAIDIGIGLERIAVGFFKMTVLSSLLLPVHTQAVAELTPGLPLAERVLTGTIVAMSYTVYLYFNFSGYTDMVIGIARFLRLRLPENFDRPFATGNFIEFWGHWHMTLSNWLKTYVFNPLLKALMRRIPAPAAAPFLGVFAFFVTFFLIGIWHGQTFIFVIYGVLLGLGVSVNKLYQVLMTQRLGRKGYRALAENPTYHALCRGLNFTWFTLSLLCFWATGDEIRAMAEALGAPAILLACLAIFIVATIALAVWETARKAALSLVWGEGPLLVSRYVRTAWNTALVVVALATILVMEAPTPDIVYKAF